MSKALIGISFTSVTFHSILEEIDKIDKKYPDDVYFPKVEELLKPYYKIKGINKK